MQSVATDCRGWSKSNTTTLMQSLSSHGSLQSLSVLLDPSWEQKTGYTTGPDTLHHSVVTRGISALRSFTQLSIRGAVDEPAAAEFAIYLPLLADLQHLDLEGGW